MDHKGNTCASASRGARRRLHVPTANMRSPCSLPTTSPAATALNLSAGGATTEAEYKSWIDGFAAGIGVHKVVVIVEPDGLGLLPGSNCGGPTETYPYTDAERYEELNYAVDALKAQPNARVYLDGTHSAWLERWRHRPLAWMQAGVQTAPTGFYLNAVQLPVHDQLQVQYGTWISKLHRSARARPTQFFGCPEPVLERRAATRQRSPSCWASGPAWRSARYGEWSDESRRPPTLNTSGLNLRYCATQPTTHFVVDTSRNGLGPWQCPSTYVSRPAGEPHDWCNPPGRGLGLPPHR